MIITKEHQEAMIRNYAALGKSTDEVAGFIEGMEKMLELVTK